jgi:hypothetical protein
MCILLFQKPYRAQINRENKIPNKFFIGTKTGSTGGPRGEPRVLERAHGVSQKGVHAMLGL